MSVKDEVGDGGGGLAGSSFLNIFCRFQTSSSAFDLKFDEFSKYV